MDSCGTCPVPIEDTAAVVKSRTFDLFGEATHSFQKYGSLCEKQRICAFRPQNVVLRRALQRSSMRVDGVVARCVAGIRATSIVCFLRVKPDLSMKVRLTVDLLRLCVKGKVRLRQTTRSSRTREEGSNSMLLILRTRGRTQVRCCEWRSLLEDIEGRLFRVDDVHRYTLPRAFFAAFFAFRHILTHSAHFQIFYGSRSDCEDHSIKSSLLTCFTFSATETISTTWTSCD